MKIASLKFSDKKKPSFYDVKIDDEGNIRYYNKKGQLHRLDGPAVEMMDGLKAWFVNGKLHRQGGPAVVMVDGTKAWYVNGKQHRLDGPAVEYAHGSKQWYVHGTFIGASSFGFTQEKFEQWKKEHGL